MKSKRLWLLINERPLHHAAPADSTDVMSDAGIFYNHLNLSGGGNRLIMLMSLVGMMLDQQLHHALLYAKRKWVNTKPFVSDSGGVGTRDGNAVAKRCRCLVI